MLCSGCWATRATEAALWMHAQSGLGAHASSESICASACKVCSTTGPHFSSLCAACHSGVAGRDPSAHSEGQWWQCESKAKAATCHQDTCRHAKMKLAAPSLAAERQTSVLCCRQVLVDGAQPCSVEGASPLDNMRSLHQSHTAGWDRLPYDACSRSLAF